MIRPASQAALSLVLPLYNKEKFVIRALESIKAQSLRPLEVIVVDDGSTDAGVDRVSEFQFDGIPLRVIRKENGGASSARNAGVEVASGSHVVFLDADDELLPGALEAYDDMVRLFPECGAFGLNFEIRRGRHRRVMTPRLTTAQRYQKVDYWRGVAWGDSYLTASSACIRKDVFETAGLFAHGLVQREDPHLWLRITRDYEMAFCGESLVVYHQDDPWRICNLHRAVADYADTLLAEDLLSKGRLQGERARHARVLISSNYLSQAVQNLREGNVAAAKSTLRKAKFSDVNNRLHYVASWVLINCGLRALLEFAIRLRFILLAR